MNRKSQTYEIPLHLCQVLEEEFESLHETLDWKKDGDLLSVGDGGRRVAVAVKVDWDFHAGHVRRDALAEKLREAYSRWKRLHPGGGEPEDRPMKAEPDLAAYLARRHPGLLDDARTDEQFVGDLRRVLDDAEVFRPERFERLTTLREDTRGLVGLLWEGDGGVLSADGGRASDQTRFGRLLLEDAFPEEVRRAYDLRLARVVRRIHELGAGRSAVCLSGGGIRSGTFALGVLQSLARRGFLDRFDYLSTVSGGGYIGGWLSAWIHRHPEGLRGVVNDLEGASRAPHLEPEPEPLRHLRDYSNFTTPKTGVLSADAWTFVTIYVRNLLLNWVVLLPLLASVLMIPRVANAAVLAQSDWATFLGLTALGGVGAALLSLSPFGLLKTGLIKTGLVGTSRRHALLFVLLLLLLAGAVFAAGTVWPGWRWRALPAAALDNPRWALLLLGALLNGYAVAFMRLNRPSSGGAIRPGSFWDKRRDQNTFLRLCLLPLCLSAMLLTTFWAWHTTTPRPNALWEFVYFILFGAAVGLAGTVFYWFFVRQTWKNDPAERELRELRARGAGGARGRAEGARADDPGARAKEERLDREVGKRKEAVRRSLRREARVLLVSGVVAAFLLWVVATRVPPLNGPVVDPFSSVTHPGGGVTTEVLPYAVWWGAEWYTTLAFPAYLLVIFLGITLFVGFTSRRSERPPAQRGAGRADAAGPPGGEGDEGKPEDPVLSYGRYFIEDEDREWLARASAWLLIVAAAWLFVSALVIFGPLLYFAFQKWLLAAGGISGLVAILGGRSSHTPGKSKKDGEQNWAGTLKSVGVNLVVLASFVFFACLVLVVALLTGALIAWFGEHLPGLPAPLRAPLYGPHGAEFAAMYPTASAQNAFRVAHFPTWVYLCVVALALHGLGRGSSLVINLNKFSLHAGYRDRIIRAFLGASRPRGERQENPFTGFDPRDNLYMDELRPWVLRESDFRGPNGLASFVAALSDAEAPGSADPSAGTEAVPSSSKAAAARLRAEIERIDGESRKYFAKKDPPGSIDTNPSFRTALFGDLSRVLQVSRLEGAPEFGPHLEGARANYGRLTTPTSAARGGAAADAETPPDVLLNRLLLLEAFPEYLKYPPRLYRLMHVVNMALNLVGGDRLAWQQRRAESFTSTPLHSGSLFVGYRRTRDYGGKNGISLGTAVAVSGAAASSNMGYFSPSPFVTLALTFFNARLGWWLGNPGVHGARTYFRSHPQSALSPILDEAFGMTDDTNPYVLLSDGGHFENLGLYEMVLRRCRNIVVVDGSADPEGTLEGLGDAVRKIRIDLGIPIEFKPPFPILPRPESEKRGSGGYCAVGDVHYEAVDADPGERAASPRPAYERHRLTGRLVYVKPTIYGGEPRDVFNYAMSHPDFPHESTADQFFDEPQFESHRMLGFYILEQLFEQASQSPAGVSAAGGRDLQKFIGWLDERAEDERRKAAGKKKGGGDEPDV
ncbi:MAG TPA: patatin-like phospholipase family protein [Pyrinomonadaceae bacterium]|jgi:hypothetical protein